MADLNVTRRGFCPGVWAPMESGDGLLVRVRVRRGRLSALQLRGLARAAEAFGNGVIELTRRASLQVRGVSRASLPDLQAELTRLGLADASPSAERRPWLAVCPLSGLDPRCAPLEQMADSLEPVLSVPERVRGLSEKFLVLVSGGSDLFDELEVDVRVQLPPEGLDLVSLSVAGAGAAALELGAYRSSDAPRALAALLALLGATAGGRARMRELVAARGSGPLLAALAPFRLGAGAQRARWAATYLGFHSGSQDWFGLELPFGSLDAADFCAIAELAERFGSGELRLLPGRALLLPGVREHDRSRLAELARERDFIVERPVPSLRLVACSGAPACRSAHAETRRLARDLAPLLRASMTESTTLHVSGCEKSCAWGGAADITLVPGADGCRLGFGADVAEVSRGPALSLDAVRERLSLGRGQRLAAAAESFREPARPRS